MNCLPILFLAVQSAFSSAFLQIDERQQIIGTWVWSIHSGKLANGSPLIRDNELTLKIKDGELIGTIFSDTRRPHAKPITRASKRRLSEPIQDAKFEDGQLT